MCIVLKNNRNTLYLSKKNYEQSSTKRFPFWFVPGRSGSYSFSSAEFYTEPIRASRNQRSMDKGSRNVGIAALRLLYTNGTRGKQGFLITYGVCALKCNCFFLGI